MAEEGELLFRASQTWVPTLGTFLPRYLRTWVGTYLCGTEPRGNHDTSFYGKQVSFVLLRPT